MRDIQIRILHLLGSLGGYSKLMFEGIDNIGMLNNAIISKSSGSFNRYLAWDPEKRLIFCIPYPDIKIDISLGIVRHKFYTYIQLNQLIYTYVYFNIIDEL